MSGTPPVLLQTEGLSLAASGRCLVQALDWSVRAGECWGLIGRNAAGKSTLLRALAGLPVPQRAGGVRWLGRPQQDWPAADAALLRAYVPQQAVDRFPVTVGRLMELSALRGEDGPDPAALLEALDALHLAPRDVLRLSGGERQRVALAQCAVQGAPLWLLDEPVSFQDPAHQALLGRWLPGSVGEGARVFSAHDVNWIARTATHVLALPGDGRWRAGPVSQLLDAALLEAVYGCPWQQLGGQWLPA